jgi:hypothetical protein
MTKDSSGNPNGVVRRDLWESLYAAVQALLFPQLPPVASGGADAGRDGG